MHAPNMSTRDHDPLFILDDDNDIEVEEDPAVIQARENLVVSERLQQEHTEQRRLERA